MFDGGLGLVAPLGRLVFFGSAGGGRRLPEAPLHTLMELRSVTGFMLSAWRRARPQTFASGVAQLAATIEDGRVRSVVHARLPLGLAAEAHRIVESRSHRGRVVLVV